MPSKSTQNALKASSAKHFKKTKDAHGRAKAAQTRTVRRRRRAGDRQVECSEDTLMGVNPVANFKGVATRSHCAQVERDADGARLCEAHAGGGLQRRGGVLIESVTTS